MKFVPVTLTNYGHLFYWQADFLQESWVDFKKLHGLDRELVSDRDVEGGKLPQGKKLHLNILISDFTF